MGAGQSRGLVGFAITVAFELERGAFPAFLELVTENARQSVEAEPDCLRFDVLTPVDAGSGEQVLLYEIYRDEAAFDAHLASPHFRRFDERTRDLVRRKTVRSFSVAEHAKASIAHAG